MRKLIHGIGINDATYSVSVPKEKFLCPFYVCWAGMLGRCYNLKSKKTLPSYEGCSVCEEWLTFSNFREWMVKQDWMGNDLDKDILIKGNKIYSPDACVFVDQSINKFLTDRAAAQGDSPLGTYWHKKYMKFVARCSNQISKKRESLGYFDCPQQAHQAWRKRKHELACQLADLQTDSRVAQALRTRYL